MIWTYNLDTLVKIYNDWGERKEQKNIFPLGSADESGSSTWGHAGNSLMNNINFGEFRMYCKSSSHNRVLNLKSTLAGAISYMKTGTGSFSGIESSFIGLTGHTSNLPNTTNVSFLSNQGDQAMTNHVFYLSSTYHWLLNAGNRWECDDYDTSGAGLFDTLHQIWVRP